MRRRASAGSRVVGLVAILSVALLAQPARAAQHHHHRRANLNVAAKRGPSRNAGAKLALPIAAKTDALRPVSLAFIPPPSFVEFHSGRVRNDLFLFHSDFMEIHPTVRVSLLDISRTAPPALTFMPPSHTDDQLEISRLRERLLLFRDGEASSRGASVATGIAMFGATTLLSAHAPKPLRVLFDRKIHLGPSVFDGGGLGAGIGGRGL